MLPKVKQLTKRQMMAIKMPKEYVCDREDFIMPSVYQYIRDKPKKGSTTFAFQY
jgi:hypothetical protein